MTTLSNSTPLFFDDDDNLYIDTKKPVAASSTTPASVPTPATPAAPKPTTSLTATPTRASSPVIKTVADLILEASDAREIFRTVNIQEKKDSDAIFNVAMEKFFNAIRSEIGLDGKDFKKLKSTNPVVALMQEPEHLAEVKKATLAAIKHVQQTKKAPKKEAFEFEDDDDVVQLTEKMGQLTVRNSIEEDEKMAAILQAEENAKGGAMVVRQSNDKQMVIPSTASTRMLQAANQFVEHSPVQTPNVFNGPVSFGGNVYTIQGATPAQVQQAIDQAVAQSSRQGDAGLSRLGGPKGNWTI